MSRPSETYRGFRRNSFFGRAASGNGPRRFARAQAEVSPAHKVSFGSAVKRFFGLADGKRQYKYESLPLKTYWR